MSTKIGYMCVAGVEFGNNFKLCMGHKMTEKITLNPGDKVLHTHRNSQKI